MCNQAPKCIERQRVYNTQRHKPSLHRLPATQPRPNVHADPVSWSILRPVHVCWIFSWYKRKASDEVIFNEGNTAATYNEQRLFLSSSMSGSTRLLGGSTYGGTNQVYAHKRGNHKAEMS